MDNEARLANISSVESPVKVRNNEFIVTYRYMLSFGFSVVRVSHVYARNIL